MEVTEPARNLSRFGWVSDEADLKRLHPAEVPTPSGRRTPRQVERRALTSRRPRPAFAGRRPGERSGDEPYIHAADEECVIVLDGELEVWVDGDEYTLGAGDSLMLDPKLPHRYQNVGQSPVTSIWVMSPPIF